MSTRKALAFSFADRYAGLLVHTVAAMVIARLLTPTDIGVYSVAMVMIGFIATFRDLGAGQYLVQTPRLGPEDVRAVWAVQLGLGLVFATIIAIASGPAATFYREPRIQGLMLVVALNFAITPFAAFHYAWLMREMRFGALAIVRGSGALGNAIVAIALAWLGEGPISLAWGSLAATIVSIVVISIASRAKLPWFRRMSGLKQVILFGGRLTMVSVLGSIKDAAPDLLLGRLQGMTAAGLFSRGQGLVAMFERLISDAANSVAMPYFAKQTREGKGLVEPFLQSCALFTVLGWSFVGCLGILAYPIIRLLYGTQWDDAVDPTRWMAAAMAFAIPASACFAPLLACGAVSKILRIAVVSTCVNVAFVGVGAHFGVLTLTQLMVPSAAFSATLSLFLTKQQIGFRWVQLFKTFGQSSAVAIAAASVPLAVTFYLGWRSPSILALSISIAGAAVGFLVGSYATRHLIWEELVRAVKAIAA